ncbi:unnamed protein product, partial [Medioppia subpectinata]
VDQAIAFERDIAPAAIILYFQCSDDVMVKRLLSRGKTSGRVDDNEATIKQRLATFHENTQPILDQYPKKVVTISAERDPDVIYKDVQKALDSLPKANSHGFNDGLQDNQMTRQLCPKEDSDDEIILYENGVQNSLPISDNIAIPDDKNRPKYVDDIKIVDNSGKVPKAIKGICLTIISALFFSITTVIVKYVKDVDPSEMAFFRFLGILLFTLPVVMEVKGSPFGPSKARLWLVLRGVAGATSLYFRYNALHYMSIANATVIVLSMPVFVFIFAKIFLKESFESFGLFHIFALFVTLIGITFASKVDLSFTHTDVRLLDSNRLDNHRQLIGVAFSIGATIVGSSVYVLVRKLRSLHHSVILFNFSLVAITETSVITLFLNDFKLPTNIPAISANAWLMCLVAIFSFYGQLLLTKALQAEEAGLVSIIRASSELIYSFVFQITIFKEIPDKWSVFGALLVMSSVLMTTARKWIITLPKDSKIKK